MKTKNLKNTLSGIAAAILAHAAAYFLAVLAANPAAADEHDPVFVGFLALTAGLIAALLAAVLAHFLTRRRIADRYERTASPDEDARLRRTAFLEAAGPGEAVHAFLSLFLPGQASLFFNPGGAYLAESVLADGTVLGWRNAPSAGGIAVYVLATLFAAALTFAVRALLWRIRWRALDERAKDREALSARDENRMADANRSLRERYGTLSDAVPAREEEKPAEKSAEVRRGRSTKEILLDALLVFVLMTVAGLASNVLPAAIGFFFSLPIAVEGYTEAKDAALWLLFGTSAMLVCMAAGFFFARFIGYRQADYRVSNEQARRPDPVSAALPVLLGALWHGAACLPLVLNQMGSLFYAGPVQYFARFLGHGRHALFQADMFDFPSSVKLAALGIYLLFFAAAILPGIYVGFRARIGSVEYAEAAERYDRRMRERESPTVWTAADAAAAHREEAVREERPVRETLARETEAFFRAFDRQERIRGVVKIALWVAADLALWVLYSHKTGRPMLSPSAVAFTALLVLPWRPFRWIDPLLRQTYYGEVAKADVKTEIVATAGWVFRGNGKSNRERSRLLIRAKTGGTEEIFYRGGTHLPYAAGDRVFRLGALKFPVPCSFDEDERIFCPRCGYANLGEGLYDGRCRGCRAKLGRKR
ncbi:MAG: hypothetical protein IKZ41_10950 [Clostridia bacterium]|nr:hypothetical protein [Clostridia bacterium]MBR5367130.1 hypothetical protein [Clostridia bacterium]